MKYKLLSLFLGIIAVISFAACSDNDDEDVEDNAKNALQVMSGSYSGVASASTMYSEIADTAHVSWSIGSDGIIVDSIPVRLLAVGIYNDSILSQAFSDAGYCKVEGAFRFTNIGQSVFNFDEVTSLSFTINYNGTEHKMYINAGDNSSLCTGYYDMATQVMSFSALYTSVRDSTDHNTIELGRDQGVRIVFTSTKRNS